jgi:hypothetical protein
VTRSVAIPALAIIFAALAILNGSVRAATVPSSPITTMSIPFSGVLSTNIEDISVTGILNIVVQVTFTSTTVFAKVHTNISNTTGTGLTSGQQFVGVGASLQTCGLPAGPRGANTDLLELTPQYGLLPLPPLASLYANVREGSLPLLLQLTFQGDGTVSGISAVVGSSRFSSTPARIRPVRLSRRADATPIQLESRM